MATNTCVFDMVPWVADEKNIIRAEVAVMMRHDYFIEAKTISGGRFFSERLDWEDTAEMFRKYKDVVGYFGGGVVELYEVSYDDCEVVRRDFVW